MRFSGLLAGAILAGSVVAAAAQTEPPAPPPGGPTPPGAPAPTPPGDATPPPASQGELAPPPPSPERMTPLPEGHPEITGMRGGSRIRMGNGGPPEAPEKGFELRIGRYGGLEVDCGDEPIRACVQAVIPLIEQLTQPPGDRGNRPRREREQGPQSGGRSR